MAKVKQTLKHIEVEGCIVNIRTGLKDAEGHAVTSVEIICDQYNGEPYWKIADLDNERSCSIRIVREVL